MRQIPAAFAMSMLGLCACGTSTVAPSDGSTPDLSSIAMDAAADLSTPNCLDPGPADHKRYVVISHPFDDSGMPSGAYEVLALDAAGKLTATGQTFTMSLPVDGTTIVFTPDGSIGIVAHDDGSVGVFHISSDGKVDVLPALAKPRFFATSVVMDPSGTVVHILNAQTRDNGGGVYDEAIDCSGALTDSGPPVPAKLPYGMAFLDGKRAVVYALDWAASQAGSDTHLVDWTAPTQIKSETMAFPDDQAIVSSVAITADGKYLLASDNNAFSGAPNRVAVVGINGDVLSAVQVLSPIMDPVCVVASPFANSALLVSGEGNALIKLAYDPANAAAPFSVSGPLTYQGAKPALPNAAVMIQRGTLKGLVLVPENLGVRTVQFNPDGSITDLGLAFVAPGMGLSSVVGIIGVQP